MRSIEHQYAETAFKYITEINRDDQKAGNNRISKEEYGRLCHKFPSMVMLNGLRLTVAFFNTKTSSAHEHYLKHLSEAIGLTDILSNGNVIPADSTEYRVLTMRALKASTWFKRYAVAILKVDKLNE